MSIHTYTHMYVYIYLCIGLLVYLYDVCTYAVKTLAGPS